MKKKIAILLCALSLCGCGGETAEEALIEEITSETTSVISETTTAEVTAAEASAVTEPERNTVERRLAGFRANEDNPYEQWLFFESGKADIAGEEMEFSAEIVDGVIMLYLSDGREFEAEFDRDDSIILRAEGKEITLCEEGGERIIEARRLYKIKSLCGDLTSRYPDESGWFEYNNYGDIPFLADADYIEKSLSEGIFLVSTPEELASFNYIANTMPCQYMVMQLQNDIDLYGYEWAPMGWHGGIIDMPFMHFVDGNGYAIKNMHIVTDGEAGFIGWDTFCGVYNLTIENAYVEGGDMVGIMTGQAICGMYENCHVSGTVHGSSAGAMLGHSTSTTRDCTANVIVNGEPFDFLTYNEKRRSEIVIDDPVEITLDGRTVTRPEVEGYMNLGWMVFYNGEVLHRNAEDEYSYTYFLTDPGIYEICLTAFVSGQYVPISNTVSYTIK